MAGDDVSRGFGYGFGGCFGCATALVVVPVLLLVLFAWMGRTPEQSAPTGEPAKVETELSDMAHCQRAIGLAARAGVTSNSVSVSNAPRPMDSNPSRFLCVGEVNNNYYQYSYDVMCSDPLKEECTRLVSVVNVQTGAIPYINRDLLPKKTRSVRHAKRHAR